MERYGWPGRSPGGRDRGWPRWSRSGGAAIGGELFRTKPAFSLFSPAFSAIEAVGDQPAEAVQESAVRGGAGDEEDLLVRRQRVEAVLLLSRNPLSARKLSQLAGLADATEARTLVRQLNQSYAEEGRAFRAEEIAGGYQLLTRPQLAPWLRRLGHIPKSIQLTPPAMETMAIVAYRQPVLRADIEAIRGVACGEILRQLMERDLVRISGRSDELGRPYLYATTKRFLQLFGLQAADALPAVEISELTDWSDTPAASDPNPEQHPVLGVPEEDLDVSTAVAEVGNQHSVRDEPQFGSADDPSLELSQLSVAAIDDDPEDDVDDLEDEDDVADDDFDDDDEWGDDDDDDDDEEDEDDDEVEADDDDGDSEWEEVDDEWVEDEGDDDDWDDEEEGDDDEEEDEDEEEWD